MLEDDPGSSLESFNSRWKDEEETSKAIDLLERIQDQLDKGISSYYNKFRKLNASKDQLEKAQKKTESLGLKDSVKTKQEFFTDWLNHWIEYQSLPKNIISKLPFSKASKLSNSLNTLEITIRKDIPMKVWKKFGDINDVSRIELAEYIEQWLEDNR